jgi:hypothetical protein
MLTLFLVVKFYGASIPITVDKRAVVIDLCIHAQVIDSLEHNGGGYQSSGIRRINADSTPPVFRVKSTDKSRFINCDHPSPRQNTNYSISDSCRFRVLSENCSRTKRKKNN